MPVVSGAYFAEAAYSYNNQGLTYAQYDCTHFTNLVRRTCGLSNLSQSSNAMWRSSAMLWKGTINEAYARFGGVLPQGLYLFHVIPDSDPNADPQHYGYGDGIGDVNHVGIYTNLGLGVMQSGGYDGTGVHDSRLRSYFNLAACPTGIDYSGRVMPTIPNPTLYREFYMSPNDWIGTPDVFESDVTEEQKQNANCIKSFFIDQGWSLISICGMLGNMQYDSTLNPAYIMTNNRYRTPGNATDLTLLPNYEMQFFFGDHFADTNTDKYGLGLLQKSTTTNTNYLEQSYIVGMAITNHLLWYDGWAQVKRIDREQERDAQGQSNYFQNVIINNCLYTFANYPTLNVLVSELAEAWMRGYDRSATGLSSRVANAEYWYNYFTGPNAPPPVTEPPAESYIPEYGPPAWMIPTLFKGKKKGGKKWVII